MMELYSKNEFQNLLREIEDLSNKRNFLLKKCEKIDQEINSLNKIKVDEEKKIAILNRIKNKEYSTLDKYQILSIRNDKEIRRTFLKITKEIEASFKNEKMNQYFEKYRCSLNDFNKGCEKGVFFIMSRGFEKVSYGDYYLDQHNNLFQYQFEGYVQVLKQKEYPKIFHDGELLIKYHKIFYKGREMI